MPHNDNKVTQNCYHRNWINLCWDNLRIISFWGGLCGKIAWTGRFAAIWPRRPSDVEGEALTETKRSRLVVYSCGVAKRPENFKFDLKAAIVQLQPQMFPIRAIDLRQNDQWTVGWCLKLLQNVQASWLRLLAERPIHHPCEWFSCTIFHWIADYKSDFQYCMSRKLIYLSSWLTFALHSPENVFLACIIFFAVVLLCGHRSSLMVRKQWLEKLTKKLSCLIFLIE